MLCIAAAGVMLSGVSGIIQGVEPLRPLFILGGIIAFAGIIYGVIAVRCPFCHRSLPLKGIGTEKFCPRCGKRINK